MDKLKYEDLTLTRITAPGPFYLLVPSELLESADGIDFDIKNIYELSTFFISDPMTRFYVISDEKKKTKGIFWAYFNMLTNTFQLNLFSVDDDCDCEDVLKGVIDFIKSFSEKKIRIQCFTTKPEIYEKCGATMTEQKIMEIE